MRNIKPIRKTRVYYAVLGLLTMLCHQASAQMQAYTVARIWTGQPNTAPIEDGVLLVNNGKVIAVGRKSEVAIPASAKVIDLPGRVIIPGLVSAQSYLIESPDEEQTITPQSRAIDGFDFFADQNKLVASGVTTTQLSIGRSRLIPGQSAVVKLAGSDPGSRTVREIEALQLQMNAINPPAIYEPPVAAVSVERPVEPTRPQIGESLPQVMAGLRALFRAAKDPASKNSAVKALAPYLAGDRAKYLRVQANSAAEIQAAFNLAQEFSLQIVLVDPDGLETFADRLTQIKPVLRGVIFESKGRPAITDAPIVGDNAPKKQPVTKLVRKLLDAGIDVAVAPSTNAELRDLWFIARTFADESFSASECLQLVTSNPARMMGVADRVGSIGVGKDADFIVLTGDPFSPGGNIDRVIASGESSFTRKEKANPSVMIKVGNIMTGSSHIKNGSIVVADKKIRSVGEAVSVPSDADVKYFPNGYVTPGFIDMSTRLGVGAAYAGPFSVANKLGERLASNDPAIKTARMGGVTSVLLGPTDGAGPMLAFKLGNKPTLLKEPVAIRFSVGGNLTTAKPALKQQLTMAKAYVDAWAAYDKAMVEYEKQKKEYDAAKAKAEEEAKAKAAATPAAGTPATGTPPATPPATGGTPPATGEQPKPAEAPKPADQPKPAETAKPAEPAKPATPALPPEPKAPTKPPENPELEVFKQVFAGTMPVLVEARQLNAIKEAFAIFVDEFKIKMTLIGGDELPRFADSFAKYQVPVIMGPQLTYDLDRETVNLPLWVANRQVPFAFQSASYTGSKNLPVALTYSVHHGLSAQDALAGLTTLPAKLLGLDQRIGTIEAGKDADLVVFSGPPFSPASRVLAIMIDGQWVHMEEQQ